MKRLPTIALWILAVAIALPGIVGLLSPAALGGHRMSIDALNEARSVGGTRLAIAALLALAASKPAWRRAGLVAGCVIFAGTLLGRLVSNALDGMPGAMMKPEVLEAVLLTIALVAFRTQKTT